MSGNKYWLLILTCVCLAACSPRTRTGKVSNKDQGKKEEQHEKAAEKLSVANVTLMLPLNLNTARVRTGSRAEIEKSAMPLDFYQGFKLGLDSAAAEERADFNLRVLDTKDNGVQVTALIKSGQLNASQLIVGPVFPEGIRFMTNYSIAGKVPVVSPLAASHPDEFNNPNLISVVNNIELHAQRIGDYITRSYEAKNTVVVLITTKSPADEVLGAPLRDYFRDGKAASFTFREYASVFTMEKNMTAGKQYVVMVASAERPFVVATLDKLAKMKARGSQLVLFGHPNWAKQNYSTDKLQLLNTRITSSYYVDFKSQQVTGFIRKYRQLYHLEPGEFAVKGFDNGFYFGRLIARHGAAYMKYLPSDHYKGLHNSFAFRKDDKLGYINTSLFLLEYKNYALIPVE